MLRLAQELVDSIIDWSAVDDPSAMKPCGLVCTRWLPRSRYNLFRSVCLTDGNLRPFVDIVETSQHPILSFIRHLELQYEDRPLECAFLVRLHHCPNLTDIRINLKRWGNSLDRPPPFAVEWLDSDEYLHTHLRAWSANSEVSILSLELWLGQLRDFPLRTLNSIMSCVPSLHSLRIYELTSTSNEPAAMPSFPPTLTHLCLNTEEGGDAFYWLLCDPVILTLKSLEFWGYFRRYGAEEPPLEAQYKRIGWGVETLDMYLPGYWTRSSNSLFHNHFRFLIRASQPKWLCDESYRT
jgi:hypothetical protein